ncbi:hypothetical protein [Streptomyces sp. NPDC029554]|uniref:hypothetical protein n=1 Tax=Streptomyces sp. NPDC029554 TaxID=3155126 RepID=UPI0033CA6117
MFRRQQAKAYGEAPGTEHGGTAAYSDAAPRPDEGHVQKSADAQHYVFISSQGIASINGEPVPTGDGSAQSAILDHLHRRARELARPIEASVLDQQQRTALRLRVRPDGASELLEEPYDLSPDTPVQQARVSAPPPAVDALSPAESVPPSAVRTEPARTASATAAAGRGTDASQVTGHFTSTPEMTGGAGAGQDSADDAGAGGVAGGGGTEFVDWETTVLRVVTDPDAPSRQDRNSSVPRPVPDARPQPDPDGQPPVLRAAASSPADRPHPQAAGEVEPVVTGPTDGPEDQSPPTQAATAEAPVRQAPAPARDTHTSPVARIEDPVRPKTPAPAPAVPPQLAEHVARVIEAVTGGNLPVANAAVTELRELATNLFGPRHPHTLEAYALEAYVAHLGGNQAHSTAISLRVAGLRFQQGDPRALDEVQRAAATWELLTAPHTAVPLGGELLAVWKQVTGVTAEGDAVSVPEGIRAVEARLNAFARVRAPLLARGMPQAGAA